MNREIQSGSIRAGDKEPGCRRQQKLPGKPFEFPRDQAE
jgi:hypothetical protein